LDVAQTPKYDLSTVQLLVHRNVPDTIWFSAPSRSVDEVVRVYRTSATPKNPTEAAAFILQGLLALTGGNFVERLMQWGTVADVYGLVFDGRPWYVKFVFEDGVLEEISFHPPQRPMTTITGLVIPAEEKK
jgi:hypothetical protein